MLLKIGATVLLAVVVALGLKRYLIGQANKRRGLRSRHAWSRHAWYSRREAPTWALAQFKRRYRRG